MSPGALRHRMARLGLVAAHHGPTSIEPTPRPTAMPQEATVPPQRSSAPASGWEQKPAALLVVEITWPDVEGHEASPYERWTMASHWEQTILEKVQGFDGMLLPHVPSLLSEACFASLIEGLVGARLLALATYRPWYRPPWIEKSYATQMVLPPISSQEGRQMLQSVLPMADIPEPLAQIILRKAQDNPFFLEEIVQALVEQGRLGRVRAARAPVRPPRPTEIQIPPTVHGVLAARIDQLPAEEKALLQTLAVIGSTLPWRLIAKVIGQPEEALRRPLMALQAAEFLYEQPTWPELAYRFKHVLTQDVAYSSVPSEQRRTLHKRTAQALEALFEHRLEEHYGELAHHYRHSGNTAKAVSYLQQAGHQAMQRSAYAEAINLLSTGLDLLTTLPDTPERVRHEWNRPMPGPTWSATMWATPSRSSGCYRACGRLPTNGGSSRPTGTWGNNSSVWPNASKTPPPS
jgi:hypothetical protein